MHVLQYSITSLFFVVLLLVANTRSLKIGIFTPDVSVSQVIFAQRVAEVLADAGHNLTIIRVIITPYEGGRPTRSDIEEWTVDALADDVDYEWMKAHHAKVAFQDASVVQHLFGDGRRLVEAFRDNFVKCCRNLLTNYSLREQLISADFDVFFVSVHDLCPLGLLRAINAKSWALLNSAALMDQVASYIGVPVPPSYAAPTLFDAGDHLTFVQRFQSVLGHLASPLLVRYFVSSPYEELFRAHLNISESFDDIMRSAPLVFVNSNELYDLPRPTLHKVINIGGLGVKEMHSKPLPSGVAELVNRTDNVVIFTFGSIADASAMPVHWKRAFMDAFALFPRTQFFMRYKGKDMEFYKPDNVHLMSWLPQADLLHNKKTSAFITHGGYNGMQEAIQAGKPLLTIPLFGDQFRNARIAEKHGFGRVLLKGDISKAAVVAHLTHLLNGTSYATAAERMKAMVLHKPVQPETLLIRWTEFVARFAPLNNLRPGGVDLNAVAFYNIDVYAILLAIIAIFVGYIVTSSWTRRFFSIVFDVSFTVRSYLKLKKA